MTGALAKRAVRAGKGVNGRFRGVNAGVALSKESALATFHLTTWMEESEVEERWVNGGVGHQVGNIKVVER